VTDPSDSPEAGSAGESSRPAVPAPPTSGPVTDPAPEPPTGSPTGPSIGPGVPPGGRPSRREPVTPIESGSIIERFRGTEWEGRQPPPPPTPGPSSGLTSGAVTAIVGVLILILAVGGGAIIATRSAATTGLPSFSIPSIAPTPTKAPGADVMAATWAFISDTNLSYHLESSGSLSAKSSDLRFSQKWDLSLDVAADSYVGSVTIAGRGRFVWDRFEGVIYLKQAGTKWEVTPTSDRSFRQQPLMAIDDPRELAYAGSFVENGKTLHRLVSTDAYRPSVTRMFVLGFFEFPFETVDLHMELIVTDKGVPIRATFTCRVKANAAHRIPAFTGTATFAFTHYGQGPKIHAAPKR
jgi:hypothetical protein